MSYGANTTLLGTSISIASIEKPSETLLLADSAGTMSYSIRATYASDRYVTDRHLEGANIVFADGHVKWKKMSRDADDHPIAPQAAQGVYWQADGTS